MNFDIDQLIKKNEYSPERAAYLADFRIIDVLYRKKDALLLIKAENSQVLPYGIYHDIIVFFNELGFDNIKLYIKAQDQTLPLKEINQYLDEFRKLNNVFKACAPLISAEGFVLSYNDQNAYEKDQDYLADLKLFFYDLGYRQSIDLQYKDHTHTQIVIEEKEALPPSPVKKAENGNREEKGDDKKRYHSRKKEYTRLKIDDFVDTLYSVSFAGEIFKVEERSTRTGITIQNVYVKDEDNAVIVKIVEGKRFNKEALKENKEGRCAVFYGNYRFDSYANDYLFEPDQIEFIDKIDVLRDDAGEKRVELHLHTKLSEMDGVSSPTQAVQAAYEMGHRAVAITDHLCLQGFHEAQSAYSGIMKKAGDDKPDFKVLYGCELNMVYPDLNIVYNSTDELLSDCEYVVFDLETTGLSTRYDYIIEFGAVVMRKGYVVEEKDFFIKPPIELSTNIKDLTHITDKDLRDAKSFRECKDDILNFVKGRVLVAHNAAFDYGFLNSELERIGEEPLPNPVIDTLDLSRSLLKNRRAYRLGNMCRAYNIPYDEDVAHRANYDADVLSQVFNLMLKDLAKEGVYTLNDLKNFQDAEAFIKNRAFHTTVLCRNKEGIKELYKLISISNTQTLAVFGKANTKDASSEFIAEPRIFKQTIAKYRKDLLVGSACFNGEVFEIASTRSKKELAEVISFYDYIEIQPLENYRFLYEDRQLFTKERLKQYLRDIIH